MNEIWRPVENWVDKYEISNFGNGRSLDHYSVTGRGGLRLFKSKNLTPYISGTKGNIRARFKFSDGSRPQISILVAKAFPEICGKWFEGCQVHHKDGNPLNNRADNLMVISKEEHTAIHKKLGKWVESNKNRLVGVEQRTLNGILVCVHKSISEAARSVNGNPGGICSCCKGQQATAYGFKWSYSSSA